MNKPEPLDHDQVVAHHEAGDLVSRYRLGPVTNFVSIENDGTSHGRTESPGPPPELELDDDSPESKCWIERTVRSNFAGPAAETKFTGDVNA